MKQRVLTLLKARPFSCLHWMALIITSQSSSRKWCAEIVLKGEYMRLFVLCVKYVYLSLKYRSSCIVRHTFCRKYASSKMTTLLMLSPKPQLIVSELFSLLYFQKLYLLISMLLKKSSIIILMQSNTIKLLSCLTSWEELLMNLKSWVTHQLLGFNLSFLFNVNTIET